jgi:hypothetical protein
VHTDGGLYDPVRERWYRIPSEGAPPPLFAPDILWSGRVVLLWDRAGTSPQTQLYAYDPGENRWLPPLVMPFKVAPPQGWREAIGVSGGKVVFLSPQNSAVLDVEERTFSPVTIPPDVVCRSLDVGAFEPTRVILFSCDKAKPAIASFDPRAGTWKRAVLPPVPRRHAPRGWQPGSFGGRLSWTGEHVIAWGGSYTGPGSLMRGCEHPPPGMGCDPLGPPTAHTNEGYILKPSW